MGNYQKSLNTKPKEPTTNSKQKKNDVNLKNI